MKKFKPGDQIKIIKKEGEELLGRFVPSYKEEITIVKLNSGYNVAIKNDQIKSVKLISRFKNKKESSHNVDYNPNLPNIVILHTGGTFASKISYETGAVSARFSPEELVEMFPEIKEIANIKSRLLRNMFSEDINFKHYNLIAKEIEKEIKKNVDGIIITHGTDTMHYTSAALSFILEDLSVPVILVGAQRSSDRGSSDSFLNLYCSVLFVARTDFSGVAICMHESMEDENCLILPGLKTKKLHTSRRDAFKAINSKPIARVNNTGKIEFIHKNYSKKEQKKLRLRLFKDVKIGILKSHPNLLPIEIKNYSSFDGLVVEGSGLGHFPINKIDEYTTLNEKNYIELKKLAKKIPIVMASQSVFGRINLSVYDTGKRLEEIGILGNLLDMTTETAFIKLAWLVSNYPKNKIREMYMDNLRGEINKRTEEDFI